MIGGGSHDLAALAAIGFRRVVLSNLADNLTGIAIPPGMEVRSIPADAEAIASPDGSFDMVFAHEVLHHCASPARALCEMLRVARRFAVLLEPNDSAFMRLLVRMRLSFPYELMAVVGNDYERGGMRNGPVPNFIFRWSQHEVWKTASSFLPEQQVLVRAAPYWDLGVDSGNLALRRGTHISALTQMLGAGTVVRLLRWAESLLNAMPAARRQGNKFLCTVTKTEQLQPWLVREGERVVFRRDYGR